MSIIKNNADLTQSTSTQKAGTEYTLTATPNHRPDLARQQGFVYFERELPDRGTSLPRDVERRRHLRDGGTDRSVDRDSLRLRTRPFRVPTLERGDLDPATFGDGEE